MSGPQDSWYGDKNARLLQAAPAQSISTEWMDQSQQDMAAQISRLNLTPPAQPIAWAADYVNAPPLDVLWYSLAHGGSNKYAIVFTFSEGQTYRGAKSVKGYLLSMENESDNVDVYGRIINWSLEGHIETPGDPQRLVHFTAFYTEAGRPHGNIKIGAS